LSAVLHAGWNAAVKARPDTNRAMTVQMVLSSVLMLPLLFWTGLPTAQSMPWLVLSSVGTTAVVYAMLRAYAVAPFGLVYPIMRAISVLLVVPGAAVLSGERLSPFGLAGVALMSTALAVLALGQAGRGGLTRAAWPWIIAAGVGTAGVIVTDAQGVRASGNAMAYGTAASTLNALAMLWRQRAADVTASDLRDETKAMLPVAVAAIISYLLILWVFAHASIAAGSALRDTSAVFAILIAIIWLREPITRTRLAAVVLAAMAVPLLRSG
jgi:drug/metabolite transporter (DMT)-like permease